MIKLKSPAEWQGIFYVIGACPAKPGHTNRCKSDYGNQQKRPAAGGESCKQDSFLYVLIQ